MRAGFLAVAVAALAAGVAHGQTPAMPRMGLVDDACIPGDPPMPAALRAYLAAVYDPARKGPAPTPTDPSVAAYLAAQAAQQKRDWPDLCRYRADDQRLAARPPAERRVVFMGDSITEAWSLVHPQLFTDGLVDRGISGQTTPQMLLRFSADVVALHPLAVHIMAGINDIAGNTGPTTLVDIQNNIAAMVTLAQASRIRVVLASTLPAAAFPWAPGLKPAPQVRNLNAWLRALAREKGLTYVDYYAAMATPEGALKPELTIDGVHPNAAGYAVMEPLTRKALAEAAPPR